MSGELERALIADRDALRDRVRLLEYELVRRDKAEGARLHTIVLDVGENEAALLASTTAEVQAAITEKLAGALARHIVKHEMHRIQARSVGTTLERRFFLVFTGVGVGIDDAPDLPKPIVHVREGA